MNKFTISGFILIILGGCILGFQAISSMMTAGDITWKTLTLAQATGPQTLAWVEGLSMELLKTAALFVVTMPLYILFFTLGAVMLVVGGFTSK